MKYCSKCGANIDENVKFCPKCGAEQAVRKTSNDVKISKTGTSTSKTSNSILKIAIIAVAVLVVIILFKSCAGSKSGTVDVAKCYKYSFTGIDSRGALEGEIDAEVLKKALIKANKKLKTDENLGELEDLVKHTRVTVVSNDDELSNGDKIELSLDYNEKKWEKYDIKPKKTSWKIKVKGLREKTTINIKECYLLTISGMNSKGEVESSVDTEKLNEILVKANPDLGKIENEDDLDDLLEMSIDIDKEKGLSNGDKIVISLDEDSVLEEYGLEINPKEWTVEVSGLLDEEEE